MLIYFFFPVVLFQESVPESFLMPARDKNANFAFFKVELFAVNQMLFCTRAELDSSEYIYYDIILLIHRRPRRRV